MPWPSQEPSAGTAASPGTVAGSDRSLPREGQVLRAVTGEPHSSGQQGGAGGIGTIVGRRRRGLGLPSACKQGLLELGGLGKEWFQGDNMIHSADSFLTRQNRGPIQA